MSNQINGAPPPAARAAELAAPSQARVRAGGDRSEPVAAPPATDRMLLTGEAAGLQVLERSLAAPAGIDVARVNEVRAALADGSYQVDPQQVASRMLAFEDALLK